MGKYVDGNELIQVADLSEVCSGVIVDGKDWQRRLAYMLATYLPITDIMANPIDYPEKLKNDLVTHPDMHKSSLSYEFYNQTFLEDANISFFQNEQKDWKQKYFVRDGLDPQDKKHIVLTYTEQMDKFKGIVYDEIRCVLKPTEINGLFAMERVETFTQNIHNAAIRSAVNISDDEYIEICKHNRQRVTVIPVCLDGVKVANVLNDDWYESQMALVHRDGRVLQLENGNRYGDLLTKEYPCKSKEQSVFAISQEMIKKTKEKNKSR